MAKSKKPMKRKDEEIVQETVQDVVPENKEVITEEGEESNPSTVMLNGILNLVKEKFNLSSDYSLLAFKEDPKKVTVSLATEDYRINLVISGPTLLNLKYDLGLA